MSRQSCPPPEVLRAFASGDLSETDLDSISKHLDGCPPCQQQLAGLDGLDDTLLVEIRRRLPAHPEPSTDEQRTMAANASSKLDARVTLPRQMGDFRIIREIGRGGMGVVYEAEQVSLGRLVALKVLAGHVTGDRNALHRFRREAMSAARLHHTNIVPVFEVGRAHDVSFYAMQLIQGQSLDQVIDELRALRDPGMRANGHQVTMPENTEPPATISLTGLARSPAPPGGVIGRVAESLLDNRASIEGPRPSETGAAGSTGFFARKQIIPDGPPADERLTLPPSERSGSAVLPGGTHVSKSDNPGERQPYFRSVAQIGRQAAQGLDHAHARGIVHRDIKPSNLLLDTDGVVWITDFGLAKPDNDNLTATGDILGTLRYMSPERFVGKEDGRADIYALGLTLYELLTLRPAHDSSNRMRLIEQVKNEEPARPRSIDPNIPRDLETIVLKAIDKEPGRRYQTAHEMAEDLRRFLADEPIKARQISTRERYWRWARRNPAIAVLGSVLTAMLVITTIGSLIAATRFANLAGRERSAALAERSARLKSESLAKAESLARADADRARKAESREKQRAENALSDAVDQTYIATRNEVRAMRLAHEPGWRSAALERIGGLVRLGSRKLDRFQLRTEAFACLAEIDVKLQSNFSPQDNLVAWHVRFSPDGRTLAATDQFNSRVYLRDLANDRDLAPISKSVGLAPFAFHPGGALAVPSAPGRVTFHALAPGQPTFSPITGEGHALNLAFNLSGDRLAVAWGDINPQRHGAPSSLRCVTVHETASGRTIRTIAIPENTQVTYKVPLALSPDGRLVATVAPHYGATLHAVDRDAAPVSLGTQETYVSAITFHPDGQTAAVCAGRVIVLWNLNEHAERLRIPIDGESLWDLVFSPDGRMLGGSTNDGIGHLWDGRSGRELAAVPSRTDLGLSFAFSPRGDRFAVGARSVSIFGIEGHGVRRTDTSEGTYVNDLAFDPHKPALYHCGGDEEVHAWNLAESTARVLKVTTNHLLPDFLRLSPGAREIALGFQEFSGLSPDQDFAILVFSRDHPEAERWLKGPRRSTDYIAIDPTGRRLAASSNDGELYVWNFVTGTLLNHLDLAAAHKPVYFLDAARLLVAADRRLCLIAADHGEVLHEVTLPVEAAALTLSADGSEAFIGTSDGAIHRASLPGLQLKQSRLVLDHPALFEITVSPDGSLLAATTQNGTRAMLLDAHNLDPLALLPDFERSITSLKFDPKGRYIALAGSKIVLWDLARARDELATIGLAWDKPAPAAPPRQADAK